MCCNTVLIRFSDLLSNVNNTTRIEYLTELANYEAGSANIFYKTKNSIIG